MDNLQYTTIENPSFDVNYARDVVITRRTSDPLTEETESNSTQLIEVQSELALRWPSLAQLGLRQTEIRARSSGIGGSDANIIMSGLTGKIIELWREKRGDIDPPDLSDRLPVALGSWTEPFNRQWYEKLTGQRVESAGISISCSTYAWRRCTLDGFIVATGSMGSKTHKRVWEAGGNSGAVYAPASAQHGGRKSRSGNSLGDFRKPQI